MGVSVLQEQWSKFIEFLWYFSLNFNIDQVI